MIENNIYVCVKIMFKIYLKNLQTKKAFELNFHEQFIINIVIFILDTS